MRVVGASTKDRLRIALVAGALGLASACSGAASVPAISGDELAARIAAGDAPLVVDLRTPEEFAAGHVPDALNIPGAQLADRLGELGIQNRGREIVVYGASGTLAAQAEATLRHAGFRGLRRLEGDRIAWRDARR